eukprot:c20533_g1_i4 orf=957-1175(+)
MMPLESSIHPATKCPVTDSSSRLCHHGTHFQRQTIEHQIDDGKVQQKGLTDNKIEQEAHSDQESKDQMSWQK